MRSSKDEQSLHTKNNRVFEDLIVQETPTATKRIMSITFDVVIFSMIRTSEDVEIIFAGGFRSRCSLMLK